MHPSGQRGLSNRFQVISRTGLLDGTFLKGGCYWSRTCLVQLKIKTLREDHVHRNDYSHRISSHSSRRTRRNWRRAVLRNWLLWRRWLGPRHSHPAYPNTDGKDLSSRGLTYALPFLPSANQYQKCVERIHRPLLLQRLLRRLRNFNSKRSVGTERPD